MSIRTDAGKMPRKKKWERSRRLRCAQRFGQGSREAYREILHAGIKDFDEYYAVLHGATLAQAKAYAKQVKRKMQLAREERKARKALADGGPK